jgi:hypothetical protein
MQDLFGNISDAIFSEDRKYRYALIRIWDEEKPKIMFIGLNPSTANENQNDPTIRRVISFAKGWGYGGVYMLNLFAIVSSKPEILLTCENTVGENDNYLEMFGSKSKDILFAWGNFKEAQQRAKIVCEKFDKAVCLGLNKNGTPKHPLYVPAKINQINFK